jgi:DnaJ-class molecular chaperone
MHDSPVCQQCRGQGRVEERVKNLGTLEYRQAIVSCDMCAGKGVITQDDRDRYLRSMGVGPCTDPNCCGGRR